MNASLKSKILPSGSIIFPARGKVGKIVIDVDGVVVGI